MQRFNDYYDNDDDDYDDDNNNNNNNNSFNICNEIVVKLDNKHRNDHVSKSVQKIHDGKVTTLFNYQVLTDRTIPNNKADVLISDNRQGTCMSIDVAICGDRNVIKKETEKMLKYKELIMEI
jgi:hypothetical protein